MTVFRFSGVLPSERRIQKKPSTLDRALDRATMEFAVKRALLEIQLEGARPSFLLASPP